MSMEGRDNLLSASSSAERSISEGGGKTVLIEANSEGGIVVPQGPLLLVADFIRSGPDLLLTGPDGASVLIKGYFELAEPAALMTEGGAVIPPDLVLKLAGAVAPGQYAQAQAQNQDQDAAAPIGKVTSIEGAVSATHADGSVVELAVGASIFQGDILETGANSTIGLVFVDKSSFAVGEDAIERQLAHTERNEVRAAYNAAEWLADRRYMLMWWSEYLDAVANGRRVIPFSGRIA